MSGEKRRRGRPKGTGIDDWERLLSIANLIEQNPKLKVTTAIKVLGFTDPSVIRRLRDKYKAHKVRLSQVRVLQAKPSQVQPSSSCTNVWSKSVEVTEVTEDVSARSGSKTHTTHSHRNDMCIDGSINGAQTLTTSTRPGQFDADQTIAPNRLLEGARATATIYTFQAHALDYLVNQPATAMSVDQHETVLELLLGAFAHATQAVCD
ncbi:MAG: hypothetical protein ACR2PG_16680 [Hyphomicrobiaceae bacterium]